MAMTRWRLPVAALIGVLVVGTLIALYGALHRTPPPAVPVTATATVVESVPCARPDARDTVRAEVGGQVQRLPVDACGNPVGFQLAIEVVTVDGRTEARLAGTGSRPRDQFAERINAVLLVLAGLTGALYALVLGPTLPRRRPGQPALPPSPEPLALTAGAHRAEDVDPLADTTEQVS